MVCRRFARSLSFKRERVKQEASVNAAPNPRMVCAGFAGSTVTSAGAAFFAIFVWTKIAKKAAPADVTVDPAKPAQTILGFGAAFTDASCFTLSRLNDSDRANLLHTMFGQDQHALSMGRIP